VAKPLNPLNSPWRISPVNPEFVLGADQQIVTICPGHKFTSLLSACPQMFFALEAVLAYYEPDNSEEAEILNLGKMALAKAKGDEHE